MDFDIIGRAGLTQLEFSRIAGFSRPSVNLWLNGRKKPGPAAEAKLRRADSAIRRAIKSKVLPAPAGPARDEVITILIKAVNATEAA